jgi:hypothetical protein
MPAYPPTAHQEHEVVENMNWAHSESIPKEEVVDSCFRTISKDHGMLTEHNTLGIIPHMMGKARIGQTKVLKMSWGGGLAIFLGG